MALLVAVLAGYVVGALAVIGLVPASAFVPGVVVGSVASLVMVGLFFHPWPALGILIDVAPTWAVLLGGWRPGETAP